MMVRVSERVRSACWFLCYIPHVIRSRMKQRRVDCLSRGDDYKADVDLTAFASVWSPSGFQVGGTAKRAREQVTHYLNNRRKLTDWFYQTQKWLDEPVRLHTEEDRGRFIRQKSLTHSFTNPTRNVQILNNSCCSGLTRTKERKKEMYSLDVNY